MMLITLGQRLSAMPPRAKLALMIGADALFLPLFLFASIVMRLGSVPAAANTALLALLAIGWLTLPVLGVAGLYRTVVRYIDLRVIAASGAALAVVVLAAFALALTFEVHVIPRSALLIYWFVAFTYVITSRFIARVLLRQGIGRAGPAAHTHCHLRRGGCWRATGPDHATQPRIPGRVLSRRPLSAAWQDGGRAEGLSTCIASGSDVSP